MKKAKWRTSWFQKIIWRLQFKKVRLSDKEAHNGRCIDCDANSECWNYYCPCKWNQHLKK